MHFSRNPAQSISLRIERTRLTSATAAKRHGRAAHELRLSVLPLIRALILVLILSEFTAIASWRHHRPERHATKSLLPLILAFWHTLAHERPSVFAMPPLPAKTALTAFIIALVASVILTRAKATHRRLSEARFLKALAALTCSRLLYSVIRAGIATRLIDNIFAMPVALPRHIVAMTSATA